MEETLWPATPEISPCCASFSRPSRGKTIFLLLLAGLPGIWPASSLSPSSSRRLVSPFSSATSKEVAILDQGRDQTTMADFLVVDSQSGSGEDHGGIQPSTTASYTVVPNVIPDSATQALLFRIAQVIAYILPLTVLVGLVGNTLSLLVMIQPHNRSISCCVYMGALAVSDNIMLLVVGHYWARTSTHFGNMEQWECTYIVYIGQICTTFGVINILSMTVDRFLAVRFPLQSAIWCSSRRAKVTISTVLIILLIYCLPYILYARIGFNGKFNECYAVGSTSRLAVVFTYISMSLNSVVPFTILLALNAAIITTISNRKKTFHKYQEEEAPVTQEVSTVAQGLESQQKSTKQQTSTPPKPASNKVSSCEKSQNRQLILMLLTVSFALLILTMPQYTNYIFISNFKMRVTPDPLLYYGLYALTDNISNRLFFLNNACNFFLYCVAGTKFRQDLGHLLKCRRINKV